MPLHLTAGSILDLCKEGTFGGQYQLRYAIGPSASTLDGQNMFIQSMERVLEDEEIRRFITIISAGIPLEDELKNYFQGYFNDQGLGYFPYIIYFAA